MVAEYNGILLHLTEGGKPAIRYREICQAIKEGDSFMINYDAFDMDRTIYVKSICQAVVKKKHGNWFDLEIIEEKEEVIQVKKKRKVVKKKIIHKASYTIGQIISDSTIGIILSNTDLSKALEKRSLKDLFEDKDLGRQILTAMKKDRRTCLA